MERIRMMSHNLWKCDNNKPAWEEKGYDCSAEVRSKGFVKLYGELAPDVIGCQEVSPRMAELLMTALWENGQRYALLWGRDTPILYSAEKFELIDSYFSLYPERIPEYEGTFNNKSTKSMTIAVFRIKENGKKFIFATTHLWWKKSDPAAKNYQPYSDEARAYQLNMLVERVKRFEAKYNCPSVIVGDLNDTYHSKCLQEMFAKGYSHAHDLATDFADESVGLHYCYGDGFEREYYDYPFEKGIDHILIGGAGKLTVRRFQRYSPEYYFPLSDHSPAFIDAEL